MDMLDSLENLVNICKSENCNIEDLTRYGATQL
jgi:DNA-binding Xre family transcriptional regulator